MFNIFLALLAILIIALLLIFFFYLSRSGKRLETEFLQKEIKGLREEMANSLSNTISIVNQQLSNVTQQVQTTIASFSSDISNRLNATTAVFTDVTRELGSVRESSRQIYEVGREISRLSELLQNPKFRGGLSETLLTELLAQIMPADYFQPQYQFKSGEKVDAVIFLGKKLVPIDAKFPLANFQNLLSAQSEEEKIRFKKDFLKDVKNRIDEISKKYIKPQEGTFNFALMFIPAENVYYEIILRSPSEDDIFNYALQRRVIPVSPNSFYAYLQTILLGLKGLQIEKRAEEILHFLERMGTELDRFKEDFEVLGTHLLNARKKYEETDRRLERLQESLLSLPKKEASV